MAEEIIKHQAELKSQLEKSLINFKKSPKARLTLTYVQVKINLLEELWTQFFNNHTTLTKEENIEAEEYYVNDHYSVAEESYTLAKCEMLDTLQKLQPEKKSTTPEVKTVAVKSDIKLPRISLPTFTGKYVEWLPFHDLFVSLIHSNNTLTEVQKLHYLKTSLSGEAEALLRHIPVTDANYNDAWSTLKRRYSNKRYIVNSIMRRLMTQKAMTNESSQTVKILLDTTNECLNALKNLKVPCSDWDPILLYITVSKLDSESIRLWEQRISNDEENLEDLPTYKQLCVFLESRFRSLELLEAKSSTKVTTKTHAFHTAVSANCKLCNGNHFLPHCKDFSSMNYAERKNVVERNGLCFNCLVPNHTVYNCRQRTSCRRCGKKHHSLLHPGYKDHDKVSDEEAGPSRVREPQLLNVAHTPVTHNVNAHFSEESVGTVLLATAYVKIITRGATYYLRALIDQGSQGSFITESATQLLGLKKIPTNCTINGLGNTDRSFKSTSMVVFNAHSRYNQQFEMPVRAFVLKSLTRKLPAREINIDNWSHIHQLPLADPDFNKPGKVELLLGADIFGDILTEGLKKGPRGSPVAQNTHLGWILSGQLTSDETTQSYTITISMCNCIEDNNLLQRFWEIESDVTCNNTLTDEEVQCEQHFVNTHRRDEEGRYIVSLPFKEQDPRCQYGSSREVATKRFLQLERKLKSDGGLKQEYAKVMHEYLELDHMERVQIKKDREKPTAVYLPHHAVVRNDKTTTKVRVVYDASCKYKNGVSLNEDLMIGPSLLPDLRNIVLRWRQYKVCLVADLVKMYRQIKVIESDYQRILWRDDPNTEIEDYRITRVTFGTACAPYLASRVLVQLAQDESEKYPIASKITMTDFYMDDLLTGGDTYEDGLLIIKQMTKLMEAGKFEIQKWNSNDKNLLTTMKLQEPEKPEKELNLDSTVKTLGIAWNTKKDRFQYAVNLPESKHPVTKRSIASDVSKLFDPMGWLAPTIIIGKVFLQRLWLTGITWDQEVDDDIKKDWLTYRAELPYLSENTVDRWLHTLSSRTHLELYGFSDASNMAYAAVVYSRVIDEAGDIHVRLLSAKTRVAPVKTISVPRLELCGAVILTRLLKEISTQLQVDSNNIYAYTDSKVVLSWLHNHPSKWKTFVANRSSEIITSLPSQHWHHVPSGENPADVASRGMSASALKDNSLWWKGPEWLYNKTIEHQVITDIPKEFIQEERIVTFNIMETEEKFIYILERFSSLERLVRVIARCRRFKDIREKTYPTYITALELEQSSNTCILINQKEDFAKEIQCLRENRPLSKISKLRSLNPLLDQNGILRVGGRLRNANIPENAKHQIILPNSHLSKLIVSQAHKKTLHGGPSLMLNYLRQTYWIIGVKNMIRREVHRCVICVRYKASTRTQMMADLPTPRVVPSRPFMHAGVDFAGPISLRMSKGRGCKTYKGYLSIFVCMSTKAIHIEIVSSLDSESFVAAFKRFTARRGHCSDIWSDNATNFIAGNKLLKDMLQGQIEQVKHEIFSQLARDGTTWHNIPAAAPHFGGLWEAGVRSVKHHLKRILGNTSLTYEEMSTVTAQIEACLNSRPISAISDDIDDLLPLTPGHFLVGEPPIVVPERSYLDFNINRLNRWQLVQRMLQHFWQRWSKEYLSRLQQRPKWVSQSDNSDIKIGQLVLVKDENNPPGKWPLARIIKLHPGNDGNIRVVTLKCKYSETTRPITKICVLPLE